MKMVSFTSGVVVGRTNALTCIDSLVIRNMYLLHYMYMSFLVLVIVTGVLAIVGGNLAAPILNTLYLLHTCNM